MRPASVYLPGHLRDPASVSDELIAGKIEESIAATRETMEKGRLSPHDIGRVVFVGGPTLTIAALRDKVAFELGIAASTDVIPMTAVAEGAAVIRRIH